MLELLLKSRKNFAVIIIYNKIRVEKKSQLLFYYSTISLLFSILSSSIGSGGYSNVTSSG